MDKRHAKKTTALASDAIECCESTEPNRADQSGAGPGLKILARIIAKARARKCVRPAMEDESSSDQLQPDYERKG